MIRMPKIGPKGSILAGLGHNLCIQRCFFVCFCNVFVFAVLYLTFGGNVVAAAITSITSSARTSINSKSRHSTHQRKSYQDPSEQASPAEASRNSITSRRQHHQQKQVSPAEAIITSPTSRTRHDKQHRQCRPKPAEPAVPADASISSRASFTSR